MAYICKNCGKTTSVGKSQKHRRGVAGKRWKNRVTATPRLFRPNLQTYSIIENGKRVKVKLCAKCIKRLKASKS
jgi:ribosomal protein L28